MILNIVPLPKRKLCGCVSSMQPLFVKNDAIEDTWGFGCTYDISDLNNFSKYKLVERIKDFVVERIIYSNDPLTRITKWWDTDLQLYPVWSKMLSVPFKPHACVYRYLDASAYLAMCGCVDHPITQTIFTPVYTQLRTLGLGDLGNTGADKLATYVVPGDDETNMYGVTVLKNAIEDDIQNCSDAETSIADTLGYNGGVAATLGLKYQADPYYALYGKCPIARQLKPLISWQYLKSPILENPDPFWINAKTVTEYDCQMWNGTLKTFLYCLESSGYTDISINVRVTQNREFVTESRMSVMYLGSSPVYERDDFVAEKKNLIEAFLSCVSVIVQQTPETIGVSVVKTWNEEVFIVVHKDNKKDDKYFIDLAALSIGSPSFTDING